MHDLGTVPANDLFSEIVLFAMRYAIDRGTYAVEDVAYYIEENASHISTQTLEIIQKEISQRMLYVHDNLVRKLHLVFKAVMKELKRREDNEEERILNGEETDITKIAEYADAHYKEGFRIERDSEGKYVLKGSDKKNE